MAGSAGARVGLLDDYELFAIRRDLRPNYIRDVLGTMRRVERTLGSLTDVSARNLQQWWDSLDVSPATRTVYAGHLATFYRWCQAAGHRDDDPTRMMIKPRIRRRLPRPIREENLRLALEDAREPVRCWLLLSALSGLRACEIATLHRDDIGPEVLIVRDGKGGHQRAVPLHPIVTAELAAIDEDGWLFPNRRGSHVRANWITQRTNRHLHGLGIPETQHQLRHLFATAVYRQSRDLRLTQELLGHASPLTTAVYTALVPGEAAIIVRSLTVI